MILSWDELKSGIVPNTEKVLKRKEELKETRQAAKWPVRKFQKVRSNKASAKYKERGIPHPTTRQIRKGCIKISKKSY